jgi:hypothetical protein
MKKSNIVILVGLCILLLFFIYIYFKEFTQLLKTEPFVEGNDDVTEEDEKAVNEDPPPPPPQPTTAKPTVFSSAFAQLNSGSNSVRSSMPSMTSFKSIKTPSFSNNDIIEISMDKLVDKIYDTYVIANKHKENKKFHKYLKEKETKLKINPFVLSKNMMEIITSNVKKDKEKKTEIKKEINIIIKNSLLPMIKAIKEYEDK